ncbi:MAG: outer membrane protein assembly factor BamD [Acidobacteriota bacterium]|nr:outer membrane protein assembly factor BamD [Acidobacteriota bacterium]
MKVSTLVVCALLALPAAAPAASKEIQELQRDVALLQQQIRDLQSSQDKNFAAVTELARQSIESANRANTGVAVVTANLEKTLEALRNSTSAPLAAVNSRLNDTSSDLRELHQAVADQAASMARMQQTLSDIKDLVKSMQAPVAPPPAQGGNAAAPAGPPMPAGDLYQAALGDYQGGHFDLAMQGFSDYLKYYPTEQFAPNSQFYIGMLDYQARKYDQAVTDFDNVLEHYTHNPKTDEAMLYKGRALMQIPGRRTEGATTFRQLLKDSPKTDPARAACEELKNLGMNCTVPGATRAPAKRKK